MPKELTIVEIIEAGSDELNLNEIVKQGALLIADHMCANRENYEFPKKETIAGVSFFIALFEFRESPIDVKATWENISEVVGRSVETLKNCYYKYVSYREDDPSK